MAISGTLTYPDVPGRISEHNSSTTAHSVRIDDTVSEAGMAAEAKAVKDKLDEITGDFDDDLQDLTDEVTDLKSAITLYTGNESYVYTKNKSISRTDLLNPTIETNWECVIIACSEGDIFSVRGYGGSSTRLWMFSDSSGELLTESAYGLHTEDYIVIIAPENAAYLCCNSKYTEIKGHVVCNKILVKKVNEISENVNEISENIDEIKSIIYSETVEVSSITSDFRLNESDGCCSSNNSYELVKYRVVAGDILKINSDDRFQFQTIADVPVSGVNNRVGNTYGSGIYYLLVPQTATYLIISKQKTSNAAVYYSSINKLNEVNNATYVDLNNKEYWEVGGIGSQGENYDSRTTSIRMASSMSIISIDQIKVSSLFDTGYIVLYTDSTFVIRLPIIKSINYTKANLTELYPTVTKFRIEIGNIDGDTDYFNLISICILVNNISLELIKRVDALENISDIVTIHKKDKEVVNVLTKHATHNSSPIKNTLTALWVSDIHFESKKTKRIIDLLNSWGVDIFDIAINTGDTVDTLYTDGLTWYDAIIDNSTIPMLNTVGNHDAWTDLLGNLTSATNVYDMVIAPVASQTEIVQPDNASTNGYNYYYKDVNGVRIIFLDCMYWDNTQLTWFSNTLSGAITSEYPVIACVHYPFAATYRTFPDSIWNVGKVNYDGGMNVNISAAEAVQTFINNGGNFVCWLQGHSHLDRVYTLNDYGSQLCLQVTSLTNRETETVKSNDESAYNYDAFSILTVDTAGSILKLYRVGADVNNVGQKHKCFVWDYANKQIVGEW